MILIFDVIGEKFIICQTERINRKLLENLNKMRTENEFIPGTNSIEPKTYN